MRLRTVLIEWFCPACGAEGDFRALAPAAAFTPAECALLATIAADAHQEQKGDTCLAAPRLIAPRRRPLNKQQRWQERRRAARLCITCGKKRALFGPACDECRERHQAARRTKKGCRPWRPGHPGRRPLTALLTS